MVWIPPWDPSYTNTSNPVPSDVILPWAPAPVGPTFPSVVVTPEETVNEVVTDVVQKMTALAMPGVLGSLGDLVVGKFVGVMPEVTPTPSTVPLPVPLPVPVPAPVHTLPPVVAPPTPPSPNVAQPGSGLLPVPPEIDVDVLTHKAARNAALRSLAYGTVMSAVTGVTSVIGSVQGIDFFTRDGLVTTLSILGGSVVHSVITYFGHLKFGSSTLAEEAKLIKPSKP